jgi:transposase, IS5 family
LGRPPKDPEINAAHKQQLSADQRRRNVVEGVFGSGKRKYSLKRIMARLAHGAATSISMSFLVMCAEKILRLLRLFFVLFFACLCCLLRLHTSPVQAWRLTEERWNDWPVTAQTWP